MTGTNAQPLSSDIPSQADLGAAPISPLEIDYSCRMPLLLFFVSASIWLLLALTLGLISSIKLHLPDFLSNSPWLSYGRVRPAYFNALLYGFASQAALASALWIISRLGRTRLYGALLLTAAGSLWNLGVTVGIIGIFAGDSTGFEWLEVPRYASPFLFVSYALIGICGVMTFYIRRERQLYISQWFLFAALLWFPWIYSTAQLLLVFFPARGVMQAIINTWFNHNLIEFWFGAVGLSALFYFIPKLLGRPLYSHWLGVFAFWLFVFFAGWGGLLDGNPVPRWLTAVSTLASFMMILPVMAVAINLYLTVKGHSTSLQEDVSWRFILFAAAAYTVHGLLAAVTALRPMSQIVRFTEFTEGLLHLGLLGFFAMAMFGSIYYIVPRLTQERWASEGLVHLHYWASAVGIILYALSLCVGGLVQGAALRDPIILFLDVLRKTSPFLTVASFALAIFSLGSTALVVNLAWTLARCSRCCCCADFWLTTETKPSTAGAAE